MADAINIVHVDVREVTDKLKELGARADNLGDVMAQAAEILRLMVEDNFELSRGYVAGKWPDLSEITLRLRRASSSPKILQDSSNLVQSVNPDHGPDFAEVGTNLNYAKFHILGAELVPLHHKQGVWILPKRDPFDINVDEAVERAAQEVVEAIARST